MSERGIYLTPEAVKELKCRWCKKKGETIYDNMVWCFSCLEWVEQRNEDSSFRTYADLMEAVAEGDKR